MFETDKRSIFFFVVLLAVVSLGAALLLKYIAIAGKDTPATTEKIEKQRDARLEALVEVAPAKISIELPLLGEKRPDEFGYPMMYVDKAALRGLLLRKRYEELTSVFEQFQKAFEADYHNEYWLYDSADTFGSPEPALLDYLNEWAEASPRSFAPYLARGTYFVALASAKRGTKWGNKTPTQDIQAMEETLPKALSDIDKTIQLNSAVVAAYRVKLQYLMFAGGREEKEWTLRDAVKAYPSCFQVRVTYLFSITPRWCGSYEEMEAFTNDTPAAMNPKFRFLKGYIDLDKATLLFSEEKHLEALTAIEKACSLGDHWEFLHERGRCKHALKDWDGALNDFNRALKLRPNSMDVLIDRARIRLIRKEWEEAGKDMLEVLRVDPTNEDAKILYDMTVKGLIYEGWEQHKAGNEENALRIYNMAAEIAPENKELKQRRAFIITNRQDVTPGVPQDIQEARGTTPPDTFQEMQTLDYNLARKGKYREIVDLWTKFIMAHPEEARAYLERGGAYYHLGKLEESLQDAQKACDMGITEGCAQSKRLGSRLKPK